MRDGRRDEACATKLFCRPTSLAKLIQYEIWKEEIFAPVLSYLVQRTLWTRRLLSRMKANLQTVLAYLRMMLDMFADSAKRLMQGCWALMSVYRAMAFFPFSGWKKSFYGDLHANGTDGVEFYKRKKMVTARWKYNDHYYIIFKNVHVGLNVKCLLQRFENFSNMVLCRFIGGEHMDTLQEKANTGLFLLSAENRLSLTS
nr:hypothetical protein [Cohnella faecalis]